MIPINKSDLSTGIWNDSLSGDFLWTNANIGEAAPDVMTPLTYTVFVCNREEQWYSVGGHPFAGNIGGRMYANISTMVSFYACLGLKIQKLLEEAFGRIPQGIEIPRIPLKPLPVLREALPRILLQVRKQREGLKSAPEYLASSPGWCRTTRQQIQETRTASELAYLWNESLKPGFFRSQWALKGAAKLYFLQQSKLHATLTWLVGEGEANTLLSSPSGESELLASLGLAVGIARVKRGRMNRAEFLERYGHRGPQECELSVPQPVEDPAWLDRQLGEFDRFSLDAEDLLAKRRSEYEAAWQRFMESHPPRAKALKRQVEEAARTARAREMTRSEFVRLYGVIRAWAIRAGELTGFGNNIFFLTLDELLSLLSGREAPVDEFPARRKAYDLYNTLPPYPTFIRGSFDPIAWAAGPNRRSDIYDSTATPIPTSSYIRGFAGAAGCVEGRVRFLSGPEQGDQLQPGEILVAVTTNVGWTPLFPRAAAVVTDVGAPLSHAAIVARELGIPAVVGCTDASMRLHTGDRVRVDGGQGLVQILDVKNKEGMK